MSILNGIKKRPYQLTIIVACLLIYIQTIYFDFSPLDEKWLITDRLNWLRNFLNIFSIFSSSDLNIYFRPVLSLTFFVDVFIANGKPSIFHLTNILLHVANCLILFELLKGLLKSPPKAFFFTLFFLLHPLCVHAIAWVPGRNDSLLCLFVLSHILFLIKYLRENKNKFLIALGLCFLFALFTKETAIMIPFVSAMIFLVFKPLTDKRKIVYVTGTFFFCITLYFLMRINAVEKSSGTDLSALVENLPNSFLALILYFGKSIIPVQQSVMPTIMDSNLLIPIAGIVLPVLAILKLGLASKKVFAMGIVMSIGTSILPVIFSSSGFYKEHYEHRFYLPLAGLIIAISQINFEKIKGRYIIFASYSLLLIFGVKTYVRCNVYKNAETFAEAGIIESPSTELFHTIMGEICMRKGSFEKAIEEYDIAAGLRQGKADIYNNRGYAYASLRQFENAVQDFSFAIKLDSNTTGALQNRAMAYYVLKKYDSAIIDVKAAIRLGQPVDKKFIRDLLTLSTKPGKFTSENRIKN